MLVVENGTGLLDSNSYVSVLSADTYFSDRGLTFTDNKEGSLIQATDYLDTVYKFKGTKLVPDQSLQFPRVINNVTVFPKAIVSATLYIALKLSNKEELNTEPNLIKKTKVDVLETEYFQPTLVNRLTYVDNMLRDYTLSSGLYNAVELI